MHLHVKEYCIQQEAQRQYDRLRFLSKQVFDLPRQQHVVEQGKIDRQTADVDAAGEARDDVQTHRRDGHVDADVDDRGVVFRDLFAVREAEQRGDRIDHDPRPAGAVVLHQILFLVGVLAVVHIATEQVGKLLEEHDGRDDRQQERDGLLVPRLALRDEKEREPDEVAAVDEIEQDDDQDHRHILLFDQQRCAGKQDAGHEELADAVVHPREIVAAQHKEEHAEHIVRRDRPESEHDADALDQRDDKKEAAEVIVKDHAAENAEDREALVLADRFQICAQTGKTLGC